MEENKEQIKSKYESADRLFVAGTAPTWLETDGAGGARVDIHIEQCIASMCTDTCHNQ